MKNKFIILICLIIILALFICSCQGCQNEQSNADSSTAAADIQSPEPTDKATETTTPSEQSNAGSGTTVADIQNSEPTDKTTETTTPSDTSDVCQHSFGDWETVKQPTCKEEGKRVKICKLCSALEISVIEKSNEHTEVTDAAVAPTCKNTGLTEGSHCSVCNEVLVAQAVVPKTEDHTTVTDLAVPASCKKTGLTEGSHCSVCNTIFVKQQTIPQLDHQYENNICKKCGESNQIYSKGLSYEKIPNGYKLVGIGSCKDVDIIVPSVYNGQPVLAIGSEAFRINSQSNETTKSIVLCEGIKTIEDAAFAWCKAVESITLPNSIESIGADAFLYNKSLKSIVIPEKVTVISQAMFRNCHSLKSITFESEVTTIENWAFHYCGIESITLPDTVIQIGQGAFLESSIKTCNIPKNLTYLGKEAFHKSDIEEIVFDGNLSEISAKAFMDCDSLKTVTFNSSIKKIGESAFNHASNLETVVFSVGLTEIEKEAFAFCQKITKLSLPNSLLSIGEDAFRYNLAVTELHLPTTLKNIGNTAFINCKNLKSITIPASLTEGGQQIFNSCGLETVVFEEGAETVFAGMFAGCKNLNNVTFSTCIKDIQGHAFYDCSSLVIESLPSSLETVAINAFTNCTFKNIILTAKLCKIKNLFYGSIIEDVTIDEEITEISDYLFCKTNISAIELPAGVTKIGVGAFKDCKSLASVSFSSNLTHIAQDAFSGCNKISELVLPSGLKSIGANAFSGCNNIPELMLPSGLKSIGANAFDGLKLITTLVLPESLEELGNAAFANCTRLSEITVPNVNLEGVFKYCNISTVYFYGTTKEAQTYICKEFPYSSNVKIYCSDGIPVQVAYSYNKYGTDISWVLTSDGVLKISGTGSVPYVNMQSMAYNSLVTKLVIGEGITKIENSMYEKSSFEYFSNLAEIEFSSTLLTFDKRMMRGTAWYETFNAGTEAVYIGDTLIMVPNSLSGLFVVKPGTINIAKNAFYDCKELTKIELPLSITTIGRYAFSHCEKLEELVLHEGITTIEYGAVSYCHSLTKITIPSTVTKLNGAINSCDNLKEIIVSDGGNIILYGSIASYCSSLETVVIGSGITELPINTLYECPSLKYVILRGNISKVDASAFWNTPKNRNFLCYDKNTADILASRYPDCVYIYSDAQPSTQGLFWRFSENGDIEIFS